MARAAKRVDSTDLLGLAFVSDPQLAPDESAAAVVVTRIVSEGGGKAQAPGKAAKSGKGGKYEPPRYRSRIELYRLGGKGRKEPVELTQGRYSDTTPRFSPDGSQLAFLSVREEGARPNLFLMPLLGGEARALTKHPAGVGEYAWHKDGRQIAYLSRGEWEDEAAKNGLPRRITKSKWRFDGAGVLPSEPAQVHLVDTRSGKSRKLTELVESGSGLVFSHDGATLFLVVQHPDPGFSAFRGDLLAIDVASGKSRTLLEGVLGLGEPVPAPDGASLVYSAPADPNDMVSAAGLWSLELKKVRGGLKAAAEPRLLSGEFDTQHSAGGDSRFGAYPGKATWLDDGSLLVITNREGDTNLVRVSQAAEVTDVQPRAQRVVSAFSANTGASASAPTALFLAETPTQPGELWLLKGGEELQLSRVNDAWASKLDLVTPQGPFTAGKGKVPYWCLEPNRPRKDKAAVVQVHGGPHTNYGYGFNFEFQLLASRGYAVVFGNPRGSSSYGFTFATAMLGDYGSVDADDVMAITEAGLKRLGRGKAPVHLTGGSYGGFMTNWLVGQTNRFASAVTQRSICNWTSMYGTSDIGPYFVERQLNGVPWGEVDALWRQSPIRYAENVTTPLLIVHSEQDHRCPIEQAEQLFAVLKRLGKAHTEFLRVPDEGHELSRSGRPDRRLARLDAIVDWFETHP